MDIFGTVLSFRALPSAGEMLKLKRKNSIIRLIETFVWLELTMSCNFQLKLPADVIPFIINKNIFLFLGVLGFWGIVE